VTKLKSPATTESVDLAAQYSTRTIQTVSAPATAASADVAAEYETRTYQKLVTPASTSTVDLPAEYKTITKRKLVKPGGFTEYREIVCASKVTSELVRSVQDALRKAGYDPGPTDNIMGTLTKSALVKYQKDKGLPVGQLDYQTLKSLGIER